MKKYLCVVCLLILMMQMVSCNIPQSVDDCSSSETTELLSGEPPMVQTYGIESYEDLYSIFSSEKNSNHVILQTKNQHGEKYEQFVDSLLSLDKIPVPRMNEKPISLESRPNYSVISLCEQDWLRLPWLFFQCYIDKESAPSERLTIRITDLSIIKSFKIDENSDIDEVLPKIYSELENYQTYESYEKNIVRRELVLADRTVTAHYIYSEDWRDSVHFLYDGMLVAIWGQDEKMTDDFWRSFSIS